MRTPLHAVSIRIQLPAVILCLAAAGSLHAQSVLQTLTGVNTYDSLGYSVSFVGDVNGDGFRDWVVGVPGSTSVPGQALIVSGLDGSTLHTLTTTAAAGSAFGLTVAGVGDMDGDGIPDVVVAAPTGGPSFAIAFSGATGQQLWVVIGQNGDGQGICLTGLADWNGDGVPDVALGGYASVRVVSGVDGSTLFTSPEPNSLNGVRVASLGDFNNDGYADLVIGLDTDAPTPNAFDAGSIRILSGPNGANVRTTYGATYDFFGHGLAAVGDVNQDGVIDYAVGATQALSQGLGYVKVFSGATGQLLFTIPGLNSNVPFGQNIALAGDVNADGRPDIIIGVPNAGPYATFSGMAFVHSGVNGNLLFSMTGPSGSQLGLAVAGHLDCDLNGHDDVIVAEPTYSSPTVGVIGRARVVSFTIPATALGYPVGTGCGTGGGGPLLTLTAQPVLGQSTTVQLANGGPSIPGTLVAAPGIPVPFPIGSGCVVQVDFASYASWVQLPIATDALGAWSLPVQLAPVPVLAGVHYTLQALTAVSGAPFGIALSNGVALTFGY